MKTTSKGGGCSPCRQDFHRFAAVIGDRHNGSGALEQFGSDLLIHFVVFDQQNANAAGIVRRCILFRQTRAVVFIALTAEQIY